MSPTTLVTSNSPNFFELSIEILQNFTEHPVVPIETVYQSPLFTSISKI